MKQTLINRYLAGETTISEERELKQLLLDIPAAQHSKAERSILELLSFSESEEVEEDIFAVDYTEEYDKHVRPSRPIRLWPWLAAACVAALLIVFLAPPREEAKLVAKVTQPVVVKENTKDSVKIEKTQKPITEEKHIAQTAKSKATNTQPKRNAKASSAEPVVTTNDFAMAEDITATEVSTEDIQSVSDEMMEEFYANSANIQRRGQELIYRVSMNSSLPSNNNQYTNL